MKRLDRAAYLVFLLILMADVAIAHASTPVNEHSGGVLILNAAGEFRQFQASPSRSLLAFRQSAIRGRIAGLDRYKLSLRGWSKDLAYAYAAPEPVTLGLRLGSSVSETSFRIASPSLGIFEHSGSPAP